MATEVCGCGMPIVHREGTPGTCAVCPVDKNPTAEAQQPGELGVPEAEGATAVADEAAALAAARAAVPLARDMHVQYFANVLKMLPSMMSSLDTNRLSLARMLPRAAAPRRNAAASQSANPY